MQITTFGAIFGLLTAIILIIKKFQAVYSLMLGAFIGGLVGGANITQTVDFMANGAMNISPSILRALSSGVLAGSLIKTGAVDKISEQIVKIFGEKRALFSIAISTMVLAGVGVNLDVSIITVVAMFVGGIGVMNIMYVSVMERQREIGIRRAIGAKPRSILFQFLVEAVFITVCGGILGTIVGFTATNYVSKYIGFEAIPSLNSLFYAIVATILTGVVFGLIPAFKASKLDPIKAIYK